MTLSRVIAAARGGIPVDLLLTNARIINVFSGEILSGNIGIIDGVIVGFGEYAANETRNLEGKIVSPGFIDSHLHIESAMVGVSEFARAVLPHGTTAVVADPHEIANVYGIAGIRYMLDSAKNQPMGVYYTLSSCVPATEMETAGACLSAEDLSPFWDHPAVVGLAEMMNFPGVLFQDPQVHAKIASAKAHRLPVDGHAPGLSGLDLNAYIAAGVSSDHECTTVEEAMEKLRAGMHIMIREGTGAKNLNTLLPMVNERNCHRLMWCTDDRHAQDIMDNGHIDDILRRAIRFGVDPVTAVRMATLSPATYFGLSHLGAVSPGKRADLVILSDLSTLAIDAVYTNGSLVASKGEIFPQVVSPDPPQTPLAMNVSEVHIDFSIPAAGSDIRVIQVVPDQILTESIVMKALIKDGKAVSDPSRDLLKMAVVERHRGTGNIGNGFVRGIGLKQGAIASSVAHDSHNIIIVGTNDADMKTALARIVEMGGGLITVADGQIKAELALPVGGLMSLEPIAVVRSRLDALVKNAHDLGSLLKDPFMTLSFLALPVIPKLKLTDKGLIDVGQFAPISLFVKA